MVEEVFAFAEECEVFLRILEAVTDMRFGFTPARTEPVEQLAEPRTLALAGREKPERKDCTTAIVMSEPLKQIHFGHDDGNFARIPNRLDVGGAVPVPPVFARRRYLRHRDDFSRFLQAVEFGGSRV